jgi:hypothetical protein
MNETNTALASMRGLARPLRLRITHDTEGFPIIPGRYGRVEWYDGSDLAIYSDHPRLFEKVWAIPGVRHWQTGDEEMRALFEEFRTELTEFLNGLVVEVQP